MREGAKNLNLICRFVRMKNEECGVNIVPNSWVLGALLYEGGAKNNRNLNVARELEVFARCAAWCRESTQYSSSMPCGVSLG
jgi:hypothetical protein